MNPTNVPTNSPTYSPTMNPTFSPTANPTNVPTNNPTFSPTMYPTNAPTWSPTVSPSFSPTNVPTNNPTDNPTDYPTFSPTQSPSNVPTMNPTLAPTISPTDVPTNAPTEVPTFSPTDVPSKQPTKLPTLTPTKSPTITQLLGCDDNLVYNDTNGIQSQSFIFTVNNPNIGSQFIILNELDVILNTKALYISDNDNNDVLKMGNNSHIIVFDTKNDGLIIGKLYKLSIMLNEPFPTIFKIHRNCLTKSPTLSPTISPTYSPTMNPTESPTLYPTNNPTQSPTVSPTPNPTNVPSVTPTNIPTLQPTKSPTITKQLECETDTYFNDTNGIESQSFIFAINTPNIGVQFTILDNNNIVFNIQSLYISDYSNDNILKMVNNTHKMIFDINNDGLIIAKEYILTLILMKSHPNIFKINKHCLTLSPTQSPTNAPTMNPTNNPTNTPTYSPTDSPTYSPTLSPTMSPTESPTISPTNNPTQSPTNAPTFSPTMNPTNSPTYSPTIAPTMSPTLSPTNGPTYSPTSNPTHSPSISPTPYPTYSPSNAPTMSPTYTPTNNPTKSPTNIPTYNTQTPSISPTPKWTHFTSLYSTFEGDFNDTMLYLENNNIDANEYCKDVIHYLIDAPKDVIYDIIILSIKPGSIIVEYSLYTTSQATLNYLKAKLGEISNNKIVDIYGTKIVHRASILRTLTPTIKPSMIYIDCKNIKYMNYSNIVYL